MSFDPDAVSTITFDSFSTIVDVDAAANALPSHIPSPTAVANLWRTRSLMYAMVSNFIDAYQPFYEMNRDALSYALAVHDIDATDTERDEILEVYYELDVFDDIRDGMIRLRDLDFELYVVSNGNPAMLDAMISHANIEDLIRDTISADEIHQFKPAASIYRHAAARAGTPIGEIAHVTAGWSDVLGAMHAGMQGVWVDRKNTPWEPFNGEPDLIVKTLHDLADRFETP